MTSPCKTVSRRMIHQFFFVSLFYRKCPLNEVNYWEKTLKFQRQDGSLFMNNYFLLKVTQPKKTRQSTHEQPNHNSGPFLSFMSVYTNNLYSNKRVAIENTC